MATAFANRGISRSTWPSSIASGLLSKQSGGTCPEAPAPGSLGAWAGVTYWSAYGKFVWGGGVCSEVEQQVHALVSCAAVDGSKEVCSEVEQQVHALVSCAAVDGSKEVCSEVEQQVHALVSCAAVDGSKEVCSEVEQQVHALVSCAAVDGSKEDSEVEFSSENLSDEEYVPNSVSESSDISIASPEKLLNIKNTEVFCIKSTAEIQNGRPCQESVIGKDSLPKVPVCTAQLDVPSRKVKQVQISEVHSDVSVGNTENTVEDITGTGEDPSLQSSNISSSVSKKNYCYICGKPQSKFTRHLKIHENSNVDVARALALPKHSKERQKLLNKLRNKGNYEHNADVLANGTGLLKLRRKPKKRYDSKDYVHCMYCHAMFLRRDLWRHVRNCLSKPVEDQAVPGRTRVLSLATMSNAALCQQISQGVWKLLTVMKDDDISAAVRSDFCILQLAQSFYNKHGQDPTKYDYIRQKLREVGRLLLILRKEFSVQTLEDAVRPANFNVVIQAVKKVLNLKNHELDQVADFLGHDIRVHREYYRLPEATTQLAKISKLLLAMEKDSLSNLQGKTLEEIEIEDKLDFSDSEHSEDSDAEEAHLQTQTETDTDPALGGPSKGMKKARRPVVNPPSTSDGMSIHLTQPAYPLRY
ncbi:hypothetical protein ROHU_006733 [Labeo rohita]|uniref:Uncharacterized protein n=1 Tax=Labeo rohita TaxID=84645 RepID=A0A498MNJ5_LABRO|nr:hypothetical protein ROHU_006733 [Labeo rohita]